MCNQTSGIWAFGTTLDYLMVMPCFAERAHLILVPPYNYFVDYGLLDQARLFWRVLRAATQEKALLLLSSRGTFKPELLAILVISFWPKRCRPIIVLHGEMWEPDGGLRGLIESIIVKLIDRVITRYAVQSSAELEIFPQIWGVNPEKMHFIPSLYTINEAQYTIAEEDIFTTTPLSGENILSIGNRFREYAPLVEAARRMPERKFILVTRLLDGTPNLPPNIITGEIPQHEFARLLHTAAAVVIPLREGLRRSAGHQTYLNAMLLKRPTIVNDVHGVRDHIRDHETGLIVDGSPEGYVKALRWVLDPANREIVRQICENAAHDVMTRFSPETHAKNLVALMDEAMQASSTEDSR